MPQNHRTDPHDEAKRAEARRLSAEGKGKKRIAAALGVDPRTVGRWLAPPGLPPVVADEVQQRVVGNIADCLEAALLRVAELVRDEDRKIALRACELVFRYTLPPPTPRQEEAGGDVLGRAQRLIGEGEAQTVIDVDDGEGA